MATQTQILEAKGQSFVETASNAEIMELLNSNAGRASNVRKEVCLKNGWTITAKRQAKTSDTVKTTEATHFNGYSHNLSGEFRRAYNSFRATDNSAPELADTFSQVTQDAKNFIASIAENTLFVAFLNASNCREPSKDFSLLGVKTAAMIKEEIEAQKRNEEEIARKTECLEKAGYIVLRTELPQTFKLADEAIAARSQIDVDHKAYAAMIAKVGKIKTGIEGLEKSLAKASTEVAKETLTATLNEQKIELGKLEEKVATQGQSLIGLANRAKRYADMALIRHSQLVKVIDGLVEASDTATKLAETAGIEALASVQALIKAIKKTAPETLDPRAVKLVEKGRCKSIEEAMQFLKDME